MAKPYGALKKVGQMTWQDLTALHDSLQQLSWLACAQSQRPVGRRGMAYHGTAKGGHNVPIVITRLADGGNDAHILHRQDSPSILVKKVKVAI